MNTKFQQKKASDEWYTPKEIIDALGPFDLDPCSPEHRLWDTAKRHYTKAQNGLSLPWEGRVWLNPPYSQPLLKMFVEKMAEHNRGIALLYNRCDNNMFRDIIFPKAKAMMFISHRVRFYQPDGTRGGNPGCGSVLIAFGNQDARILQNCKIEGKFIWIN